MYLKRNVQARWRNHFCREKAVLNIMRVCVCILAPVIRLENRIFHAPYRLSVVYLVLLHFFTLFHKL